MCLGRRLRGRGNDALNGGNGRDVLKGNSGNEVRLPSERQLVAARLGMTPESLSRAFARLRPFGVVGHGQSVQIKDPKRLRTFCEGREGA